MSLDRQRIWLQSFKTNEKKIAKIIAITGGKGGVGKTTHAIKFSTILAEMGYKVLLIDCDYNLSNTAIKLGVSFQNNFYNYVIGEKLFDECLYKNGNFHLMPSSNGNLELFNGDYKFNDVIFKIVAEYENQYDYIFLDCPAGMNKDFCELKSKCDQRIFIVTPDKSSITDTYSLIKILKRKYGINENHLVLNKVNSVTKYKKIVNSISETAEKFLGVKTNILGMIEIGEIESDVFDTNLLKTEKNSLHEQFINLVRLYAEKFGDSKGPITLMTANTNHSQKLHEGAINVYNY
ncbi:MAG: AAA family ATPase [Bacteriovoracaceae bacterium]